MTLRKPLRFLLTLFLAFVIAGGLFYWAGTRTGLVEQQVNGWLDSFLSAQLPLVITIEDIGGQPWHNLRLAGVRVDEIAGDTIIPFARIDTIAVDYNWHDLLGGRWRLLGARISGVEGRLRNNPDGSMHLPWQRPPPTEPAEPKSRSFPEVEIEDLALSRVRITRTGSDTTAAQLNALRGDVVLADDRLTVHLSLSGLDYDGPNAFQMDSLQAEVIGVGGQWFVNDAFVHIDESELSGSAMIAADSIRASVTAPSVRWADLSHFISVDIPGRGAATAEVTVSDGTIRGRGTVSGELFERPIKGLQVKFQFEDNRLTLDELQGTALHAQLAGSAFLDLKTDPVSYGIDARVSDFNLEHLAPGAISTDLSGSFVVSGQGLTSEDLRVHVKTPQASGTVDPLFIDSAAGELTVTTDSLYFGAGFSAVYNGIYATLSGSMAYTGELAVSGYAYLPEITPVVDSMGFPGSGGTARGTFVLADSLADPTLRFDAGVENLTYKGAAAPTAHVTADLKHAFSNAVGMIQFRATMPDLWGTTVDSADTRIRFDTDRLIFDSIQVFRGNDDLFAAAHYVPKTGELAVEEFHARAVNKVFTTAGRSDFKVGDDTLWIIHASVSQDSGSCLVNGWLTYDGELSLHSALTNFALEAWTGLVTQSDTLAGRLFAEIQANGTLDSPRIRYRTRIVNAMYNGFPLGDFTSSGLLTDSVLVVDSLGLQNAVAAYAVYGTVPVERDGNLWRPAWSRPVDAHIEMSGDGLRLVSMFVTDVEELRGTTRGSADISGPLGAPVYQGRFQLTDGTLKIWQLVQPLTDVQVALTFRDSVATIEQATARAKNDKQEGTITTAGRMIFRSLTTIDYDLTIKGINVPMDYEYADFNGRFDFDLTGTGYNPPTIAGDVFVKEAYYRDPFESEDSLALVATEVEIDTTAWDINVNVHMPKNAWIKNTDVNAELSGNIRVLRQRGRWNYLGSLEPIRGSYTFLGNRFRNLRGEIVFDDIAEPDPRLNLEADVRLSRSYDTSYALGSSSGSGREITVQVQGRLSAPEIIPPAWLGTKNFLMALNPFGDPTATSDASYWKSATIGATGLLTGELERLGTRTLGVETFELRPSSTGSFDPLQTELAIGTYLLPDVYIYGSSEFDLTKGTEIGFEYRLRNWLTLQGNRDRRNLYHFDLNLKWEMEK